MSDHSKPRRRWTLVRFPPTAVSPRETGITGADLDDGERVPVREDCITTEDVEAVARHLAERDHGGPLTGKPICTGYKDEAALLLAHIFEEAS